MAKPVDIHSGKAPPRIHHIPEWAAHRGLSQADIARKLHVDKGTVSRWFDGKGLTRDNLRALASVLGADRPGDLFRPPEEDWIVRMFRRRSEEERERLYGRWKEVVERAKGWAQEAVESPLA
jgi:transcriptional regulator with XRE-family HTH domain